MEEKNNTAPEAELPNGGKKEDVDISALVTVGAGDKRRHLKDKVKICLELGTNKKPLATIKNFLTIMENDPEYQGVRFNEMTEQAELHVIREDGQPDMRVWRDADDSRSREYIETKYKIHNNSKHDDALKILFSERTYNPLLNLVESLEWDGENRCEHFLTYWMKAPDSEYVHEVSRLIFAGGINRLYKPGCKFDETPVLVGTKQGEGKSSIISWLALRDEYATITRNLSGDQKSIEQIQGCWIAEISELAAFKNTEVELIKSFISATADRVRLPYDRRPKILPRRCVFIGSTNSSTFLIDKTGNRRFYPVPVYSSGRELFNHEKEVRAYINQCWAEARDKYKAGKMLPVANERLIDSYRLAQENATIEDWRVGVIKDYLRRQPPGALVCVIKVWEEGLYPGVVQNIRRCDQVDIAQILDHVEGWERAGKPTFPKYGQQRAWGRTREAEADMAKDELPF